MSGRSFAAAIVHATPLLAALAAAAPPRPAAAQGARGAAESRSAPVTDVRYEVTFDSAAGRARTLRVAMSFGVAGRDPVVLSLPAWTPGAYEISNFARRVSRFEATDDAGRALSWEKADQDSWRVRPASAGRVTVRFEYLADTLDNAMAWARPDFAFFNGTNVFLYAEGRGFDRGATVAVRTRPGWRVATGMQQTNEPAAAERSGTSDGSDATATTTYTAPSYHDLVDMPFFVGRFDLDSARLALPASSAGGGGARWVRLASYPEGAVAGVRRAAALRWLERTIPPQAAVFGETPWQTYTVMQIVDSSYGGLSGLEHQNSHVDVLTPLALDSPLLASLYAHEVFHSWNVKRLRPAELVPYRYDAPQPTTLLWVSEGVTDYYADLVMTRGGLADAAGFLRAVSAKVEEVAALPPTALEDASLSTWIGPTDGTHYLYYAKGALVGLLLDVMIRDASDNRRSLDDVMRELYAATWHKGQGFTGAQWWAAVRAAAGREPAAGGVKGFDDFYRRYVDGREELPLAGVLPLAGLRFVVDTIQEPRLGVGTVVDSTGALVVTMVEPAGAFAAAGVREGDQLVSVGEVAVDDEGFGARFRARYAKAPAGTRFPVAVRRDGAPLALSATLAFAPRVECRVESDAAAGPKALRIRDGILTGTTDGGR